MNHSVWCLIELDIDLTFAAQVPSKIIMTSGIYVEHLNDWVQLVYTTWRELIKAEIWSMW